MNMLCKQPEVNSNPAKEPSQWILHKTEPQNDAKPTMTWVILFPSFSLKHALQTFERAKNGLNPKEA